MDAEVLWHPSVLRDLPATTSIVPRPVLARRMRRLAGETPGVITDAERTDAIAIVRDLRGLDSLHWLFLEAEQILAEG